MTKQKKGIAIASLVCGLLFWIPFLGIVLSISAIIFGIIALVRVNKDPKNYGGKGIAIAGIVVGGIGLVLSPITIGLGALVYFFQPEQLLGQNCILSSGLNCKSYKAETTGVTLLIENVMPNDIVVKSIDFVDEDCSAVVDTEIKSGASEIITISCGLTSGSDFRSDVELTYGEIDGLNGLINFGTVFLKVE